MFFKVPTTKKKIKKSQECISCKSYFKWAARRLIAKEPDFKLNFSNDLMDEIM